LVGNAIDLLREQEARQRRSVKDAAVDASIDKWLQKREAGKQSTSNEPPRVSEGSDGST
jgi:hypothetical protein